MELNKIHNCNCLQGLKQMANESVDCCITSPPYYGLRDYGVRGQIGLEKTPEAYVNKLIQIFTEVRRVLKKDGTLWLNLGDSYAAGPRNRTVGQASANTTISGGVSTQLQSLKQINKITGGLKPKDLIGVPWMLAFALRSSGWYLRQDIIWSKPNPMPESVTDRCTKAHEYIFLLSKSGKYYYDAEAIKTEIADTTVQRLMQGIDQQKGSNRVPVKTNGTIKAVGKLRKGYSHRGQGDKKFATHSGNRDAEGNIIGDGLANKRSVWTVSTKPFTEAHFATFPEELIVDCIKAGCPEGGGSSRSFYGCRYHCFSCKKIESKFYWFRTQPGIYKDC